MIDKTVSVSLGERVAVRASFSPTELLSDPQDPVAR